MSGFIKMKATRVELIILNNWRLYYRVILFSELCFASGLGIQPVVYLEYNHDNLDRQSSTTLHWPIQEKPDEQSFKTWRRYIKLCFKTENQQITPLGAWDTEEVIQKSPRYGY
jgi:hypothetical protein